MSQEVEAVAPSAAPNLAILPLGAVDSPRPPCWYGRGLPRSASTSTRSSRSGGVGCLCRNGERGLALGASLRCRPSRSGGILGGRCRRRRWRWSGTSGCRSLPPFASGASATRSTCPGGWVPAAQRSPMPVIAEMVCQSCGAHGEAPTAPHGPPATPCGCGGIRQVVRIVRRSRHGGSASSAALERSVQGRAGDETLTP